MEFLDKLVLPMPMENLVLLGYLQMIALSALLIYSGILFGSTAISVYFNRKAKKEKTSNYAYFAKDMIDLITGSKMFAFGLGVVPFLAIIMIYMQLLHQSGAYVAKYLIFAFVIYLAAIVLIHIYQHATDLNYIFGLFKSKIKDAEDKHTRNFLEFRSKTETLNTRTGFWGVVLLGLSLFLFIGSLSLAVENWKWAEVDTSLEVIFSFSAFFKFMHFVCASFAVTAIAFIIKKFKWQEEPTFADEEYIDFAKKFNLKIAIIFTFVLPLFFILNLLLTPKIALNYTMFGLTVVGLITIFILLHFLYEMLRKNKFAYVSIAFYLLLAVIAVSQVKEQMIFKQANEEQMAVLAANFEKHSEAMLAAMGKDTKEVNGEELYKGKCIACHDFEKVLVGPAHKNVLPKYLDNPEALAKFILNPTKIDPAFPPMPSQGLRPREAEAIAKYMLEYYGPQVK